MSKFRHIQVNNDSMGRAKKKIMTVSKLMGAYNSNTARTNRNRNFPKNNDIDDLIYEDNKSKTSRKINSNSAQKRTVIMNGHNKITSEFDEPKPKIKLLKVKDTPRELLKTETRQNKSAEKRKKVTFNEEEKTSKKGKTMKEKDNELKESDFDSFFEDLKKKSDKKDGEKSKKRNKEKEEKEEKIKEKKTIDKEEKKKEEKKKDKEKEKDKNGENGEKKEKKHHHHKDKEKDKDKDKDKEKNKDKEKDKEKDKDKDKEKNKDKEKEKDKDETKKKKHHHHKDDDKKESENQKSNKEEEKTSKKSKKDKEKTEKKKEKEENKENKEKEKSKTEKKKDKEKEKEKSDKEKDKSDKEKSDKESKTQKKSVKKSKTKEESSNSENNSFTPSSSSSDLSSPSKKSHKKKDEKFEIDPAVLAHFQVPAGYTVDGRRRSMAVERKQDEYVPNIPALTGSNTIMNGRRRSMDNPYMRQQLDGMGRVGGCRGSIVMNNFMSGPFLMREFNMVTKKNESLKKILKITSCTKPGCSAPGVPKNNQDNFFIKENYLNNSNYFFVGVCDGHGEHGQIVSDMAVNKIPVYVNSLDYTEITNGFKKVHKEIAESKKMNSTMSGTTAITVIITGNQLLCCNVGDSRAVLFKESVGYYTGTDLSHDHKPTDNSEKNRIIKNGGRIQKCYDEEQKKFLGPERVWMKDKELPGLAMTRSLGDTIAHSVGVSEEPEIKSFEFDGKEKFMILASDGIWEYMNNDDCSRIVKPYYEAEIGNPQEIANALVKEAFRKWKRNETCIDDITCIVVFFDPIDD